VAELKPRAQAASATAAELAKLRAAFAAEQAAKVALASQLEADVREHQRARQAATELAAWQQQHASDTNALAAQLAQHASAAAALQQAHDLAAASLRACQGEVNALQGERDAWAAERALHLQQQRQAAAQQQRLEAALEAKARAATTAEVEAAAAQTLASRHEAAAKQHAAMAVGLQRQLDKLQAEATTAARSASAASADLTKRLEECKANEAAAEFQLGRLKITLADKSNAIKVNIAATCPFATRTFLRREHRWASFTCMCSP
jgi:DNA repair exonuclease SbcCD ATPase subunit